MSQSEKSTTPKIEPTIQRIREITFKLMNPENKAETSILNRLKRYRLLEKVAYVFLWAEDWPDPEKQQYQPMQVATIIAYAESGMKTYRDALYNKKKTKEIFKNKFKRLKKGKEKIEKATKQKFDDLSSEVRMSSFFGNKELIGPYNEASVEYEMAKIKKDRLIPSKTRPKRKPFDTFCLDMKRLFNERTRKTPNYQLIADIANLFKLADTDTQTPNTSGTQTSETVRQNIYLLTK